MSVAFQVHKRVEALLNVTKGSRSGLVNVEFEDQSSIAASIWNRIRAKEVSPRRGITTLCQ